MQMKRKKSTKNSKFKKSNQQTSNKIIKMVIKASIKIHKTN